MLKKIIINKEKIIINKEKIIINKKQDFPFPPVSEPGVEGSLLTL